MQRFALGLIGDNIRASRSPDLHRIAGALCGLEVSYDLFIPPAMGQGFDEVFAGCAASLQGFNVTLPYKERALGKVRPADPLIARLGAVNTVCITPEGPVGHNTDHSGFIAAYRAAFGDRAPGRVAMYGAGGVGKAIAFALVSLGAKEIAVLDPDADKAARLAATITDIGAGRCRGHAGAPGAPGAVDGVVNCTPLGMVGYPGSPVPEGAFPRGVWAFDAVYTPVDTPFRAQALAAGAEFLSGYELFFHQGIEAFRLFTGHAVPDLAELRRRLVAREEGAHA